MNILLDSKNMNNIMLFIKYIYCPNIRLDRVDYIYSELMANRWNEKY